jgi:hypothetical protein
MSVKLVRESDLGKLGALYPDGVRVAGAPVVKARPPRGAHHDVE